MRGFLERLRPFAPLTLRLALAAIFIYAGAHKLFGGMDKFFQTVADLHLPRWTALAAAYSEFVGGILLAVGFLSRLGALATTCVMVVALYSHLKGHTGWPTYQLPMLCLAGTISVLLSGAGRLSVDHKLFGQRFGE